MPRLCVQFISPSNSAPHEFTAAVSCLLITGICSYWCPWVIMPYPISHYHHYLPLPPSNRVFQCESVLLAWLKYKMIWYFPAFKHSILQMKYLGYDFYFRLFQDWSHPLSQECFSKNFYFYCITEFQKWHTHQTLLVLSHTYGNTSPLYQQHPPQECDTMQPMTLA